MPGPVVWVAFRGVAGNKSRGGQVFINVEGPESKSLTGRYQDQAEKTDGLTGAGQGNLPNFKKMTEIQNAVPIVRFGTFEVDFLSRELRKYGMRIRLEEKPYQIMQLLIENAGQVVKRQMLCERLWPDTHVSFDHSLNTAVNKLRDLLGDSAQNPRFVETVPRRGYRFIAPVSKPMAERVGGGQEYARTAVG